MLFFSRHPRQFWVEKDIHLFSAIKQIVLQDILCPSASVDIKVRPLHNLPRKV